MSTPATLCADPLGQVDAVPARRRLGDRARVLALAAPAVLVTVAALVGPALRSHPTDLPVAIPYAPAGTGGPLGTDVLGRDVLSRLLSGGGALIVTAVVVALVVTALAVLLGCVAAVAPRPGRVIERTADLVVLLPVVLAVLLVSLAWPGGGRYGVAATATVIGVPYAVRLVSGAAAPLVRTGYVEAAAARGESRLSIVVREILPNLRATIIAVFGLRLVDATYVVTIAGFLQLGVQPPAADWALMIRENSSGILLNPWAVVAPSLAIAVFAVAANLAASAAATPRRGR